MQRRNFIRHLISLTLISPFLQPRLAHAAWPSEHFAGGDFASRFEQLFGGQTIIDSPEINITLPDIAENGAVVPITIDSELERIERLYIWVEKNPTPLAAEFELSPEIAVFLTARIKMAESCNVVVIARQGQRLLRNQQWVKVMQGGCGTG
ncbi:sulfur-oxidizing protein SoxY [Methylococcales bacterium]|nr:sulfur-oxidizing protein SoxY [Methylococcales bacterium]